MSPIFTPVLGWVAAAGTAFGLAVASPHENWVLGKVPSIVAERLDRTTLQLPQELPSARTLALVVFQGHQKEEARSWIEGLQLHRDSSISWLKLPVLNDPGDETERRGILQRLLDRHQDKDDRARMVPLFTNRDAFVRATGLSSADHASVLVLDRQGNVLARAEGRFDPYKAQALRETLLARND
ncbi:hypothetical protein EZ313_13030 [Ramlibacter henchirensis]|uniref:Uncharacterized protein n=1 Tax=Ramlibacter henchirensis TaxID=204072 RepID=A0A4Z0BVX3_9BURK|nr:hypothetical protein [Ramlibacter henchirensis]TFZ02195.1 hypothetical protein EZ313_13030 [Ramlibacter henchirensis]